MNIEKIKEHYDHAREKHPYFCDRITNISEASIYARLDLLREMIRVGERRGCLEALDVIRCELFEAMQAYTRGNITHAVEECYDTIAVLLRMIDVLEGRQELGNPDKKES